MSNSYQPTTAIGSHEDFYRMMLLKHKKEKVKAKKQWEKEIDKEIEEENLKLEKLNLNKRKHGLFFRNKIAPLNNLLSDDNIKKPKVNLASQVQPKKKYRYDGADDMAANDAFTMPDVANDAIRDEFKKLQKETVKKAVKRVEQAREARRAREAVKAVKTTAEAVKAAKGIKSIGLLIKSVFTVASLESFGIGLLVTLAFIVVQAILYYVFHVEAMKLEWYDWILLIVVIVLLLLILALFVIILAEFATVIEIGIWIAERLS